MSTELDTREGTVTGLSTIEGIDLDATVPCEWLEHADQGHDADYLVRYSCPYCPRLVVVGLCRSAWGAFAWGFRCRDCLTPGVSREESMTILEILR